MRNDKKQEHDLKKLGPGAQILHGLSVRGSEVGQSGQKIAEWARAAGQAAAISCPENESVGLLKKQIQRAKISKIFVLCVFCAVLFSVRGPLDGQQAQKFVGQRIVNGLEHHPFSVVIGLCTVVCASDIFGKIVPDAFKPRPFFFPEYDQESHALFPRI